MARILVGGPINIETTLQVDGFPVVYEPVRYPFFDVGSTVSGVGYNITHALTRLGGRVDLLSMVGADFAGAQARAHLRSVGVDDEGTLPLLARTCQSVILNDPTGRRAIFTDLKDIQERTYPADRFEMALPRADACILCNINFTRPWLNPARSAGKLVATDVHAVADLDDPYNRDYMAVADILFMSHERLPVTAVEWAGEVMARYRPRVLVIGMGAEGALLARRGEARAVRYPATSLRPVVSTIGAGDALFAAFVDGYLHSGDAIRALERAQLFAAWKIGVAAAGEGHLDAAGLDALVEAGPGIARR